MNIPAAIGRRALLGTAAAAPLVARRRARAAAPVLRIGVLNDQSGPYRDLGGLGSVACVRQAAAEAAALGLTVEVLSADHQNKPDVGASIARQWFDRDGVAMITDLPTSSVALAVSQVAREKNRIIMPSGAGTTELTGAQCSPNTLQWTYDVFMVSKSTATETVKAGGKSWYFITADYVFGQQLARDSSRFVLASGGTVLGNALYPFPGTSDFSSYLLQAQASGATVLGLANAGADLINCIKQAHEFGLTRKMRLAAMLIFIRDVHALGLPMAQGLFLTSSFYWDLNDRTRAFDARMRPLMPDRTPPTMTQAGCYSTARHFVKAAAAVGPDAALDGAGLVARMKTMPGDDDVFGSFAIREDGRALQPAYLFQVKSPAESKGPWDYYKLAATTPPAEAWRPMAEGHCPLVHA